MSFLVATDVVASRPPQRWPTGTPHVRVKIHFEKWDPFHGFQSHLWYTHNRHEQLVQRLKWKRCCPLIVFPRSRSLTPSISDLKQLSQAGILFQKSFERWRSGKRSGRTKTGHPPWGKWRPSAVFKIKSGRWKRLKRRWCRRKRKLRIWGNK